MSLLRKSFQFASGTLLSRVVGLLREAVVAAVFGAGTLLDAFLVANRIPNMLRELFAEGALGSAFTKVYSALQEEDPKRAQNLLIGTLWFAGLSVLLIAVTGIFLAPHLVALLTFEAQPEMTAQAVGLTRLLFPFIVFMAIGAVAAGALHQKGKFFFSAVSPLLLNIGYFLGALVFAKTFQNSALPWKEWIADPTITGLALGVLLGGCAQAGFLLWGVWNPKHMRLHVDSSLRKDIWSVLVLMGPMVIGASAGQVNVLVNTNFASSLGEGAVSWLSLGFRLLQLPIGIFGIAISSAVLPQLSALMAKDRLSPLVTKQLEQASLMVCWLMIPCSVFLYNNSLPVIQLLFEAGSFDAADSRKTSEVLAYYSFGMVFYGLTKVLLSYHYAADNTKFTMKVSFFTVFVNFTVAWFLVGLMQHKGLALGLTAVFAIQTGFLIFGAREHFRRFQLKTWLYQGFILTIAGASCLAIQPTLTDSLKRVDILQSTQVKLSAAANLGASGSLTVVVFMAAAIAAFGWSPLRRLLKRAN